MDCTSAWSAWSVIRHSNFKYIAKSILSLEPRVPLAKTLQRLQEMWTNQVSNSKVLRSVV
jgi:hypothetical protein